MKKYRVLTDRDYVELDSLEKAKNVYENWKDNYMSDGVVADESFVELTVTEDDYETEQTIEKVIAVVDEEQFNDFGHPSEQGMEWDYWAKWQVVSEHFEETTT